jgi:uncharacterized HAD superfamily protein
MKPTAIICDIDGTLAHMSGRSPYDPTKYHEDTKDDFVHGLFATLATKHNATRIIVSGRSDEYRDVTERWLKDHGITYKHLFMRDPTRRDEKNQKVSDAIIKREIYLKDIEPFYDVVCVIDDRNRVVKEWRSLGLRVLQVADGDF